MGAILKIHVGSISTSFWNTFDSKHLNVYIWDVRMMDTDILPFFPAYFQDCLKNSTSTEQYTNIKKNIREQIK